MRRLITALLASLLLIATTADRLVCADGCTDESPVQATPHASAPCAFCQGWRPSPAVVAPIPTFFVVATVPPVTTHVLAPALPTLELPPKSA